ncbi:DUF3027 domain-containing protein [Alloscardovia venturai]|uniref:DUF3027 domain-containing protein n=1 Tax=Alloscardovia venturai TaxID=1769421 RepID=A0ABW2Y5C7_9BIFI
MTEISSQEESQSVQTVDVDESVKTLARKILMDVAEQADHVGDFVTAVQVDNDVVDVRFASHIRGYEGWQWSVTLYHDVDIDHWTVNETVLLPTSDALVAPRWIPWKDRLEPSDISPTDVLGTEADDERLEQGIRPQEHEAREAEEEKDSQDEVFRSTGADATEAMSPEEAQETAEIINEFELARSRVLSPVGRQQAMDRWYTGQHGPKSLSTRVAAGKTCQTCGFFVSLKGELGTMFGVCANKWSQDDGRVVSLDHGCGEHSDIEPPEPSAMWIQPEPTVDDDDDIIFVPRTRTSKPTPEDRRLADILEEVDDPEDIVSGESTEDGAEDSADTTESVSES